jgi:hypothetical protein
MGECDPNAEQPVVHSILIGVDPPLGEYGFGCWSVDDQVSEATRVMIERMDALLDSLLEGERGGAGSSAGHAAGTSGGQGGQSGVGSVGTVATCSTNPELVPEASGDSCLACMIEFCCENAEAFACFSKNPPHISGDNLCYEQLFERINQCFSTELASGSETESWYIAAECFDEAYPDDEARDDDAGSEAEPTPFPHGGGLPGVLACAIGSRPASADPDAGVGEDGRKLWPTDWSLPESCAVECIEDW